MKVNYIHNFDYRYESDFEKIQKTLSREVSLKNTFEYEDIKIVAGVDLSYWCQNNKQYGACSIVIVDFITKKILRKISGFGEVEVPYIPGYLAFRELPLFLSTVRKLSYTPDIFIFDGNGYLHPNNMGIATHASFFINTPTIGVAKSFFKIGDTDFQMPKNEFMAYTNIIINSNIYGRALRTRKDAKPVFVSCGNYIDIDTSTKIILELIGKESRIPIPTRIADIETSILRKEYMDALDEDIL